MDKESIFGLVCALAMILLSMAMTLCNSEICNILLRDVLMIVCLGFLTPLYYLLIIKKKSLSMLGIHNRKLTVSLIINVAAAIALLAMFLSENTEALNVNIRSFYAITYIFAAGIFEMVFIYGFLRYEFERAFGVLPAIILTAASYSLHHAGFQPEFTKLFFVGLMYVGVFYFTRNIFAIFPFFWGVGAVWDVLVASSAGSELTNETTFIIALFLLAAMIGISVWIECKRRDMR